MQSDEVHVWYVDFDVEQRASAGWPQLLSEAERERGARFYFERDRLRFFAARAALRKILGAYLEAKPEALVFGEGEFGKPFIAESRVRFNASHSGDLAAIAVALEHEVGIDIEVIDRKLEDVESLAKVCFSEEEQRVLAATPEAERRVQFLRGWTRKEAVVKATGKGLQGLEDTADGWQIVALDPGPRAVGALAVSEGRTWRIQERWWSGDAP